MKVWWQVTGDYKCGHSVTLTALWPDTVRLSDLEERFVCNVCGHRGADVWPLFEPARMDAYKPRKQSCRHRNGGFPDSRGGVRG